ncbi:MAG: aminoacyl-tRNA hydrolase [Desulfobacterota bacterium]|nr:aminoacyl-tRNA hydrolase [Thermodesulfobacteriota bacterium]
MKLIVGLGNPGVQYEGSRHNIGFFIVDRLAALAHIPITTKRFQALIGKGKIDSQEILLLKPMTFMNRSGEAVKRAILFFHLEPKDLTVVHDDLDLPFGRLRFKRQGGDGGHLGVRSIVETIGTERFLRLKVGIGRPPPHLDPADYVLGQFDEAERGSLEKVIDLAAEALKVMVLEGLQTAMNRYHKIRTEEG